MRQAKNFFEKQADLFGPVNANCGMWPAEQMQCCSLRSACCRSGAPRPEPGGEFWGRLCLPCLFFAGAQAAVGLFCMRAWAGPFAHLRHNRREVWRLPVATRLPPLPPSGDRTEQMRRVHSRDCLQVAGRICVSGKACRVAESWTASPPAPWSQTPAVLGRAERRRCHRTGRRGDRGRGWDRAHGNACQRCRATGEGILAFGGLACTIVSAELVAGTMACRGRKAHREPFQWRGGAPA